MLFRSANTLPFRGLPIIQSSLISHKSYRFSSQTASIETSLSLIFVVPEFGEIIVAIMRKVVVFPEPFGPIKAKTLPLSFKTNRINSSKDLALTLIRHNLSLIFSEGKYFRYVCKFYHWKNYFIKGSKIN